MISLLILLIVVVLILYVIENLLPIDQTIRRLLEVIIILVVCVYLLRTFAVF